MSMSENPEQKTSKALPDVDAHTLTWGAVIGLLLGGLITLLTAPKPKHFNPTGAISQVGENLRGQIESARPKDPLEESLAAGKAAARRRREELGLGER